MKNQLGILYIIVHAMLPSRLAADIVQGYRAGITRRDIASARSTRLPLFANFLQPLAQVNLLTKRALLYFQVHGSTIIHCSSTAGSTSSCPEWRGWLN